MTNIGGDDEGEAENSEEVLDEEEDKYETITEERAHFRREPVWKPTVEVETKKEEEEEDDDEELNYVPFT